MAVVPTGAIYNWLTFGGVDSRDYGIYITGEGVYNAPERAVELTAIPGRNGAIPVDLGRWENIEIIYPASAGTGSQTDFRTALSDFRNAIASKVGYQRLTDTYNPSEYRMGLFIAGLEVTPAAGGKAGDFELRFNCKPQRYLTSGETAVAVASGGSISNPTQLDASPVLQITGYGDITIGNYGMTVNNIYMGNVQLCADSAGNDTLVLAYNTGLVAGGDTITLQGITASVQFSPSKTIRPTATTTSTSGITPERYMISYVDDGKNSPVFDIRLGGITFTAGTSSTQDSTCSATFTATDNSTQSVSVKVQAQYNGAGRIVVSILFPTYGTFMPIPDPASCSAQTGAVMAYSTVSALGSPTYYDCEIGEAYKISGGEVISLNSTIILSGADLPVLVPGANSVTYDGTVTQFKIVPRWWIL